MFLTIFLCVRNQFEEAISKSNYYRFLENTKFNWFYLHILLIKIMNSFILHMQKNRNKIKCIIYGMRFVKKFMNKLKYIIKIVCELFQQVF